MSKRIIEIKSIESFKELIIISGYSQRSLGRAVGISESYANQIVNGIRNPGPGVARRITNELNVHFHDIFLIRVLAKVINE